MFNGDRLRIARQRRAMTKKILAERLKVSPRAVTGWESDDYPPDEAKRSQIADVLKFPLSFFYGDDSSKTPRDAVSFRSLTTKSAGQRDAVIAMCDLAIELSNWIDKKAGLPDPSIPDLRMEDAAIAAALIRQEWGLGTKPIKNMIHLFEAKGVRVFSLAENCREIDACSFWSGGTPFCLINPEVSNERLRFDLAHELAHLTLHRHASKTGRDVEKEANVFASEFLMPIESILEQRPKRMTLADILCKKLVWKVSASALAYRLHGLGYISEWHFKSMNIEMRRRGYKAVEPNGTPFEQSKVLEVILTRLREIGMSLSFIANQTSLPESEIRGMLFGLAKVSFEGGALDGENAERLGRTPLRVVK
jgi:Zn-dependent peptidase ImmA (M78 family)/DNA-binding XRE family transcriptional regulator